MDETGTTKQFEGPSTDANKWAYLPHRAASEEFVKCVKEVMEKKSANKVDDLENKFILQVLKPMPSSPKSLQLLGPLHAAVAQEDAHALSWITGPALADGTTLAQGTTVQHMWSWLWGTAWPVRCRACWQLARLLQRW